MSYLLLFLRQPWFRQRSLTWFLYVHCLSCFLRGGTRVSATVGQNDSGQCSETGGTGWHSAFWGVLMRCSSAALGSWSFFIWIFIVRILAKSVHFLLYILTQCLFFRLPQSKFDVAIFRECLDLLLFQAIVLWEVDQGHIWRASILRTPRARPPIKGQYPSNTKTRSPMKGQYSPNTKTEFSYAARRKVNFMSEACEIVNPARKLASLLYAEITVFSGAFHLSLN